MWWWKRLTPLPLGAHVVGTPTATEVVAARRQLSDEIVQALVVRVFAGGGAQVRHAHVGGEVPVGVKAAGGAVEEGITGEVPRFAQVVKEVTEHGPAQVVDGEQVQPVVAEAGRRGDGVE
jgi:hypothetical protein